MNVSRRALLAAAAALPLGLARCSSTGPAITMPPAATLASDSTLLANGIAAIEAALPSSSPLLARVQAAATAVAADEAAVAAAATPAAVASAGQNILTVVADIAPAVIGLFPGGGTVVTIADAALALLPEVGDLLGLAGAPGRPAPTMSAAAARGVLAALPKSPHLP
jgi:lipoprotein-anchoring transpeptidase ErfK/SrfK